MGLELAKVWVSVRAKADQLRGDLEKSQKLILGSMGAVAAGGSALIARGLMAAGGFEQTRIAFETFLGSAEEAERTLEDLTQFAATTPFQMPQIETAARGLITFGERGDQMMDTLRILGNAAAGTSSNFGEIALIFNQIRGVGKLLTQDFRQLATRGVLSLQDIADHFDVSTEAAQNMLSSGQVSFEDVRAILAGMSEDGGRFANMMEKQSKSLLGLWSTVKDNLGLVAREIGMGLLPAAKALLGVVLPVLGAVRAMVAANPRLAASIVAMTTAVTGLTAAFIAARVAAKMLGLTVKTALVSTGVGIALVAIGTALGFIISMAIPAIEALGGLSPVQEALARASDALSIAWVRIQKTASIVWATIKETVMTAVNTILSMFGIAAIEGPESMADMAVGVLDIFTNFVLNITEWMQAIVENWDGIWKEMPKIVLFGASAILDVWNNWRRMWLQLLGFILRKAFDQFVAWGRQLIDFFGFLIMKIPEMFERMPELITAAITGGVSATAALVNEILGTITEDFRRFGKGLAGEAPDPTKLFSLSDRTRAIADGIEVFDKIAARKAELEGERVDVLARLKAPDKDGKAKAEAAGEAFGKAAMEPIISAGRIGFRDLGVKIQDALLKEGGKDMDKERNKLLERGLKKTDELIGAVREPKPGTLVGGEG